MTPRRIAVAGAGVTGLALGHRLVTTAPSLDVHVFEAHDAPGGHAHTVKDGGYLVEGGPNGFLDRNAGPLEMARELGLADDCIPARPESDNRFIVHGGRLRPVPASPVGMLKSDALTLGGKLRLLGEPFAHRPPADGDETVYEFAARRVGREAADRLVDTAVSGISAGDSRELSLRAAFPLMYEMERDHGSLVRAMMARRKEGKGPARLLGFRGGMGQLVDAAAAALDGRLHLGAPIESLAPAEDGSWEVRVGGAAGGGAQTFDRVLLALPARVASQLLVGPDPELGRLLGQTPYSSVAVVGLAYPVAAVPRPLDGYGYLVTRHEGLATLGVVWDSSLFEGRAPAGHALLRAVMGGPRRPEVAFLADAERVALAREELRPILGVTAEPERTWSFAWPHAIAQYTRGHLERTRLARELVARHPGLELVGSSYDGISFGSSIDAGRAAADRLRAELAD